MLYRSTHCLRRAGAAVKNLAHSASFHSLEKIAPSKSGTKHLGPLRFIDNGGDIVAIGVGHDPRVPCPECFALLSFHRRSLRPSFVAGWYRP
jgi:hypothetical protein